MLRRGREGKGKEAGTRIEASCDEDTGYHDFDMTRIQPDQTPDVDIRTSFSVVDFMFLCTHPYHSQLRH